MQQGSENKKYLKILKKYWNLILNCLLRNKFYLFTFTFFIDIFILFLRKPDTFYNPQFWAEDGTVFFLQAHNLGTASIFQPYAGYFHLFPKLVALVAQWFPVQSAPLIYNLSFIVSLGIILSYLFSSRIALSSWTKFVLGIGIVIMPLKGEMLMTLTNVQWTLALGILLLLISEKPSSNYDRFFDVFLLILTGLTDPFVIIFAPLFLIKLFYQKTFYDLFLFLLVILFGLVQHINMLIINRVDGKFFLLNFDFIKIIGTRFFQLVLGYLPQNIIDQSDMLQIIFCILFVILYIYLLIKISRNMPISLIFIPLGGLLVLITTLYSFKANPGILMFLNDRYFFIPYIAIFWSLALIIKENKLVSTVLMASIFLSFLPFLSSEKDLPLKNLSWDTASSCVDKSTPCVIPINPEGWKIDMSSKELLTPYGWSFKDMNK